MNSQFLLSYSSSMERVLSVGHVLRFSPRSIERAISYSHFFQGVERDSSGFPPTISDETLIKQIFPDINVDLSKIDEFVQTTWAAHSFMYLQGQTKMTFELIFLYIGIEKMLTCFPLYHEMDFSHLLNEFNRLYQEKSVLALLSERYGISMREISRKTKISYSSLVSLSQRKRNIQKLNAKEAFAVASLLHVQIATLCELQID